MFLTVKDLKKSYKTGQSETYVLKGINLEIEKGDIAVILGPSGSGKSTLLNIIGGIDKADSGYVNLEDKEITSLSKKELTDYRRKNVGFIFQFYNLISNLNVEENIEVCSNISKNPLDLDEMLKAISMKDKRNRFPRELSGGEQQRVSIARAIIKNPSLLLCDELTGALDYNTSKEILNLIKFINTKYNTTIIIITHNNAIANMANRVFKLRDGEIYESIINATPLDPREIQW
ncbi:ABC transporter ATP-binding protein [Clostridium sp. MSJ-4]|uniref:ABC transporter ATP-binding protein n=1 Tax=Clostridium simiarum TaxID=2841506 RepID=A0ABS6F1A5_9CLOT|nr:ABC transporter ATP-binding protein [Clostridium simiarum]MBU5591368.1 ABC transporter ATP-binding protein [Clostridium simiarum]